MYITQQLINGVDYAYNREQDVIDLFLTCVKFGADDSSSNLWAIGIKITAIKKSKFRFSSKKIFFTYLYSRLNEF